MPFLITMNSAQETIILSTVHSRWVLVCFFCFSVNLIIQKNKTCLPRTYLWLLLCSKNIGVSEMPTKLLGGNQSKSKIFDGTSSRVVVVGPSMHILEEQARYRKTRGSISITPYIYIDIYVRTENIQQTSTSREFHIRFVLPSVTLLIFSLSQR